MPLTSNESDDARTNEPSLTFPQRLKPTVARGMWSISMRQLEKNLKTRATSINLARRENSNL